MGISTPNHQLRQGLLCGTPTKVYATSPGYLENQLTTHILHGPTQTDRMTVPLGKAVLASLAHSREGGREGGRETENMLYAPCVQSEMKASIQSGVS